VLVASLSRASGSQQCASERRQYTSVTYFEVHLHRSNILKESISKSCGQPIAFRDGFFKSNSLSLSFLQIKRTHLE